MRIRMHVRVRCLLSQQQHFITAFSNIKKFQISHFNEIQVHQKQRNQNIHTDTSVKMHAVQIVQKKKKTINSNKTGGIKIK